MDLAAARRWGRCDAVAEKTKSDEIDQWRRGGLGSCRKRVYRGDNNSVHEGWGTVGRYGEVGRLVVCVCEGMGEGGWDRLRSEKGWQTVRFTPQTARPLVRKDNTEGSRHNRKNKQIKKNAEKSWIQKKIG